MAENKKSFILYRDILEVADELSDQDAGQLFKHILNYVNDNHPVTDNPIVKLSFIPIKQQLKRDLKKYEDRAQRSRDNGAKGGRPPEGKTTQKTQQVKKEPKKPDNDNDTVTVTDTDNGNDTDNEILNNNILLCELSEDSPLLTDQFNNISFQYYKLFKSNLESTGIKKTTILDKANLSTWSKNIRLMVERDGRTKQELIDVYKFLEKSEFWAKNVQSTKKLRENFETLYAQMSKTVKTNNLKIDNDELKREIETEIKSEGHNSN